MEYSIAEIVACSWLMICIDVWFMIKSQKIYVSIVKVGDKIFLDLNQCFEEVKSLRSPHDSQPSLKNTMRPKEIFGTTLFDGGQAQKGYPLNKMCFSFNALDNRQDFKSDEAKYMERFELTAAQTQAVRSRNILALLEQGGNIYYLAKFAGILGLDVQDLGALQTGMTREAFCSKLLAAGKA